jgi:T5SS/PEP-CTERM-associated repeat protein
VEVDGKGSSLRDGGNATVGDRGEGRLNIRDGGEVDDGETEIGKNPGSRGDVEVDGKGSSLRDRGNATVGDGGQGTIDITNGGAVNDSNATVGAQPGSSGTVVVDGNGSQWNNSGTLDVGPAGSGIVDVSDGGAVIAGDGTMVGQNGTVMGDGTITTPTLTNNGTVIPTGPSGAPGTLTEIGNYQQGSSGVLDIGIGGPRPSQADELKVDGSLKLGGTLDLSSLNNFHPSSGDAYEILSATGTRSGQFSTILDTANNSGLSRLDIYGPNGLIITYLPPGLLVINLTTSTPLPAALNSSNLNEFLVPLLDPTVEQLSSLYQIWFSDANTQRFNVQDRFDQLAAGSTGFVSNVYFEDPSPTGKELVEGKGAAGGKQAAFQPGPENRWGVWVTGHGDFANVANEGSVQGYNFTTGGVTVGIDYRLTNNFVIGLMGGYAHTWTDLNPGSVDVDTGWGGFYAGYFNKGFYILGAAFGGGSSFDTSRAALLGFANGSSDSQEFSTFVSGGYDFHFGHLTVGPTAAVQYSYVNIDGFSEHGSIAPVAVHEDSEESWRTDLGFRAWYNFQIGRVAVRPFVRAAWEHEYKESRLPITAGLVGFSGPPTTVLGPSLGHDSAVVNAGVSVQWSRSFSTYVSYDGQLGRDRYDSNGVSGGIGVSF